MSLLPGLPLWFSAAGGNPYGKLYLANLAVPKKVYLQVNIVDSSHMRDLVYRSSCSI